MSEGRKPEVVEAVGRALSSPGSHLLDVHSDADHNRTVYTLVGGPQALADALTAGAREALALIDMRTHEGAHPCIGALDVAPIVYLRPEDRALARDEALAVANRIAGELDIPVFLYGELAGSEERRERAFFREGGIGGLAERLQDGELEPDFGPRAAASDRRRDAGRMPRPPLVAFNVELDARRSAHLPRRSRRDVREGGGGLAGVRAIGVRLERRGVCQVSTNVHDPFAVPLREVLGAVLAAAGRHGAGVSGAELVGLAPAAALEGFPEDVELRGFDEATHILDRRLFSADGEADTAA